MRSCVENIKTMQLVNLMKDYTGFIHDLVNGMNCEIICTDIKYWFDNKHLYIRFHCLTTLSKETLDKFSEKGMELQSEEKWDFGNARYVFKVLWE